MKYIYSDLQCYELFLDSHMSVQNKIQNIWVSVSIILDASVV
jgi:hypothetical protein